MPELRKAPLGERNNNCGNLRWSPRIKWMGLADPPHDSRGYCVFTAPIYGIRALAKDLHTKWAVDGLRTVEQIITVFAPPGDHNDTGAYIRDVSDQIGVTPDAELDLDRPGNLTALVRAIIRHECGRVVYQADTISQAVSMALA